MDRISPASSHGSADGVILWMNGASKRLSVLVGQTWTQRTVCVAAPSLVPTNLGLGGRPPDRVETVAPPDTAA
jgi:hypothetical protein